MKTWRVGDPVGSGEIYFEDNSTRAAYGAACRAEIVKGAAIHVLGITSLDDRRKFIENYPMKDDLKTEVKRLWDERK